MQHAPLVIDIAGTRLTAEDRRRLGHPLVGGLILFARNWESREQLTALTADMHRLRPDLLIAVDHEGGRVQRFRNGGFTHLPPMRALGELWMQDAMRAQDAATACGYVLAAELRACGVDFSFTPVLDGKVRTADIGLLYDPVRAGERALCARWKAALEARAPEYVVRRNYPYAGKGDGLTAWFRRRLPAERYVGVELEVNQKLVEGPEHQWHGLRQTIVESLRDAVGAFAAEVRS